MKIPVTLFLTSFLLVQYPPLVYSQSEYIDINTFGISGGYNYNENEISSSSGFDVVFTLLSSIDVGYQRAGGKIENTDNYYYRSTINTSSNIFYADYNFRLRENAINLKALIGYIYGSTSMESIYGDERKINSSGVVLGLGIYPRLTSNKFIEGRVALELVYGMISNSVENPYPGEMESEFNSTRTISLGLPIRFKLTPEFNLVFSPFLSKDLVNTDHSISWGFSLRSVISFNLTEESNE